MRILHVVPTYLPAVRYGGPIFAVHGLCRALAARGHDVHVVTTNIDGSGESAAPIGVPVRLDGVTVRYFRSPLLPRLSWAPALGQTLARETAAFDVVQLHSVFLWPTWAAARSARRARVPYLVSPRGMLVKELIDRRNRLVKSAWINLIEKSNLEGASTIHATSELEAAELARFNWQLPQVVTIPNGVDDPNAMAGGAELSPDIRELAKNQPLVLFLGRLSWKKGLDRLLKAFSLTADGTLAIVGTDDEGLVPQLQNLAGSLLISDRVRFLPRTVLGRDKEHLFAAARLFVLSSYSENFGNTVLEAMRRGIPVVVTPEVGASEVVRQAEGGIVAQGEPQPLGDAINRLVNDAELARAMGDAGRRCVVEQYSWPHIAARMEALYQGLQA
jgi:glycosyltransferase involved in cell wall biosynthesis